MTESTDKKFKELTRRSLLKGGLTLGAGLGLSTPLIAKAATPDPLITDIQDWNRYLGDGVDANPYGKPSAFESHVVRRDVPWLTADAKSSVNFTPLHELEGIITPNGLCFERLPVHSWHGAQRDVHRHSFKACA